MKKILSALAICFCIFGAAQSDLKVYAETNKELAYQKFKEYYNLSKQGEYKKAVKNIPKQRNLILDMQVMIFTMV